MAQPAAATPATSRATAVARAYIDRMPPRDSGIGIGNKKTPGMPRVERVTSRGCERFPIPIPLALNWFCQPIDRQISGNLYVRLIPLFRPNVDGRRIGHVRHLPVAPACRPCHRVQAAVVGRAPAGLWFIDRPIPDFVVQGSLCLLGWLVYRRSLPPCRGRVIAAAPLVTLLALQAVSDLVVFVRRRFNPTTASAALAGTGDELPGSGQPAGGRR